MAYPIPERVAQRAFSRFTEVENGCLETTCAIGTHGYGMIAWQIEPGKKKCASTTAPRAAWTFIHGLIPEGMTIDHTCKNRKCVNVDHLRLLTLVENSRRTYGRDWPLGQCAYGHPNSELYVFDQETGRRRCRKCRNENSRMAVSA